MKRQVHGLLEPKKQKKKNTFLSCANCIPDCIERGSGGKNKKDQCLSTTFHHLSKTVCLGSICLPKYISMYVRVSCLSRRSLSLRNHLVLDPGKLLTQQIKIGCLFQSQHVDFSVCSFLFISKVLQKY